MPGKSKVETPPPSMTDVIRNRAYAMWGVQTETPDKPKAGAQAKAAKKSAKKSAKPKKAAKKN